MQSTHTLYPEDRIMSRFFRHTLTAVLTMSALAACSNDSFLTAPDRTRLHDDGMAPPQVPTVEQRIPAPPVWGAHEPGE
jgi:hypothetical protein